MSDNVKFYVDAINHLAHDEEEVTIVLSEEQMKEHDKQIRAKTLKEYMLKDCDSCEAHLREQIRAEEREKVVEKILSGCVCDYDSDCMGDREDCKTCSDYVISYQRILQLKEQRKLE